MPPLPSLQPIPSLPPLPALQTLPPLPPLPSCAHPRTLTRLKLSGRSACPVGSRECLNLRRLRCTTAVIEWLSIAVVRLSSVRSITVWPFQWQKGVMKSVTGTMTTITLEAKQEKVLTMTMTMNTTAMTMEKTTMTMEETTMKMDMRETMDTTAMMMEETTMTMEETAVKMDMTEKTMVVKITNNQTLRTTNWTGCLGPRRRSRDNAFVFSGASSRGHTTASTRRYRQACGREQAWSSKKGSFVGTVSFRMMIITTITRWGLTKMA